MLLFSLVSSPSLAQEFPHGFSGFFNVTTSARIFPYPNASDPIDRTAYVPIGPMLSGSFQYGIAISPIARMQASFEYLKTEDISSDNYGTRIVNGFRLYAVEITGTFLLPVSGERFLLYLGGGGGGYWGSRMYSVADLESAAANSKPSFGILTVFGFEYRFSSRISARAELRFRDPQISTENTFDRPTLDVGGVTYHLPVQPFFSRVNVDGNVYSVGVCWSL